MENKKSNGKMILTGAMIASAFLGSTALNANTANLFEYSSLGSGSEVRGTILNTMPSAVNALELACGTTKTKDATCSAKKEEPKKDEKTAKTKDGKCGEGKCGTKKEEAKKDDKAKTKDGKCGEGKCGTKKDEQPK